MKFRHLLFGLTLTSALVLAASANAADFYQPGPGSYKDVYVPTVWSGFYAGINGGYGWGNDNPLFDPTIAFGGLSPSGGFGGGQIGYNWEGGFLGPRFVFGIEADLQGSAIKDRAFDVLGDVFKSNLDYFGTVRGRLGYSIDRTLFYFTGGFAYGGLHKSTNDFGGEFRYNGTATGYVLGGGVEHKFAPAWSIKAEYQYINLGSHDPVDVSGAGLGSFSSNTGVSPKDDDYHTIRIGVNYHILPGYGPLK